MREQEKLRPAVSAVAEYKEILKRVLEHPPLGNPAAPGLGRSARTVSSVSQITSPSYSIPIPAQHLDTIFHVCHFSTAEQQAFWCL